MYMFKKDIVIDHLNALLALELRAIEHYLLYSSRMNSMGFNKMASFFKKESMDELEHANKFMERIFFLGGEPSLDNASSKKEYSKVSSDIAEILKSTIALEEKAVIQYQKSIADIEVNKDLTTADFLLEILKEEECHLYSLRKQLSVLNSIGTQNYILLHCMDH